MGKMLQSEKYEGLSVLARMNLLREKERQRVMKMGSYCTFFIQVRKQTFQIKLSQTNPE